MNNWEILAGILAFAVVTAVLYVWGLKRSVTQAGDLERILLNKAAGNVVHYLKSHERITLEDMARLCRDVKAGQFWSRRRIAVENAGEFAPRLAQYMVEQLLIERLPNGSYCRRK